MLATREAEELRKKVHLRLSESSEIFSSGQNMYKRFSVQLNSINVYVPHPANQVLSTPKEVRDKERKSENITWVTIECFIQLLARSQNEGWLEEDVRCIVCLY